LGVLSNWMLS